MHIWHWLYEMYVVHWLHGVHVLHEVHWLHEVCWLQEVHWLHEVCWLQEVRWLQEVHWLHEVCWLQEVHWLHEVCWLQEVRWLLNEFIKLVPQNQQVFEIFTSEYQIITKLCESISLGTHQIISGQLIDVKSPSLVWRSMNGLTVSLQNSFFSFYNYSKTTISRIKLCNICLIRSPLNNTSSL